MKHLKELRIKVLLKEYEHLSLKLEWVESHINENENEFMDYTHSIIDSNVELSELYYSNKEDNSIQNIKVNDLTEVIVDNDIVEKDPILKKLYRDVVKRTHPDVVDNIKLNNDYIKVVELYNRDDILGMYLLCDKIGIDYITYVDIEDVIKEIDKLRGRVCFLENSYIYQWVETDSDRIILDYISTQL